MKRISLLLSLLMGMSFFLFAQNPVSHPTEPWTINTGFSDEFNAPNLDLAKWNNDPNDWGTWSWEPENAYITDSMLTLQMQHKEHWRSNQTFYFTSGIMRNREAMTYGYYETRIKASDKGQGTCPAFWMYSIGQPTPTEEGGVKYCEIDAIEIFQVPYDYSRLEMNLHTRILENGVLTWKRPGQGHAELTHNTWVAPWDPRDDFHTYGVWNRLDSIFWYVDGIQRGAKKNVYWHLPMYVTVSMGLRTPYERYINGVRTVMPYPDSDPEPGFPTEMFCDYVRVWDTPAQLYADKSRYYGLEFGLASDLKFDVRYFAGNDHQVEDSIWNGVTCKLQEIQSDGTVVQEISLENPGTVGKESGLTTFTFSLAGLDPSSMLPAGNQYILKPVFRTSQDGGQDVYLEEGHYPITLVEGATSTQEELDHGIQIEHAQDGIWVNLSTIPHKSSQILIHDLTGKEIYRTEQLSATNQVSHDVFRATGIYTITVINGADRMVEKVLISQR
ncbi:family 16 glycosylhydrolase [Pontibacter sp. G13]|uniref:family 16 glycosylhydrolase n=1 Tax=Pontibacter sp. G13 TaxID=3074898 RepID=UPI00288AE3F6|nr:family 16 glycosylhydrolase [Pontibacter sp. G13]WNJ20573.1 family 16 glycosylhydrolase [Pontibacter sp. G13]